MYSKNCVSQKYIPKSGNSTEVEGIVLNGNVHLEDAEDIKSLNEDTEPNSYFVSFFTKVNHFNELPPDLQSLLPAFHRPLPDDYNLPSPPPWADLERVQKGQAFALKYFFGVNYAHSIVVPMLNASTNNLKPIIYTEKSHFPNLAKIHFLSTALYFKSLYETEIWNPTSKGYKDLKNIRAKHLSVSKRLNGLSFDEAQSRSNLENKLKSSNAEMMCPLLGTLKKDFSLGKNGPSYPIYEEKETHIYLNQMDIVLAHFAFFGFVILYPDKFAAKTATDEELSDFVHLWRYIGYMLGLDDEFNLCSGDLETVRKKAELMVEYFARPLLLNANQEWEHMSRSALLGVKKFVLLPASELVNFESVMLYLCWLLGIETPNLKEYVGWKEKIVFSITKYLMTESYKIPGLNWFLNVFFRKNIELAAKTNYKKLKKV